METTGIDGGGRFASRRFYEKLLVLESERMTTRSQVASQGVTFSHHAKVGDYLAIELAYASEPFMIGRVMKHGETGETVYEAKKDFESYFGSID